MDRFTGYWWSPTDARIAVERFDEAPVGVVTRAAIGASGTKTFEQRYPAAGTPNVDVSLFVIDPDGGNKVQVDLGPERDIYLTRVDWAPDGKTLYAQRVDRGQTRLDMLAVDPATGKSHVLFSEKAAPNHWINLSDNYRFLKDGSLIWWSERGGYGHLYRLANGHWQQLTKGPWVVTKLAGVDQQAHRLFFTATKDDVLAPQVYSLDYLKPGSPATVDRFGVRQRRVDRQARQDDAREPLIAEPADAGLSRRRERQAARVGRGEQARREPPLRSVSCQPSAAAVRHDRGAWRHNTSLEDDHAAAGGG